jgi:hypothetical protein
MQKIRYEQLNAKQKEIYNFQKVSAIFADFGYTTIKLDNDWGGADFIAVNFDGTHYLKVQLKGRLSFYKKYQSKDIYICFYDRPNNKWYLYPHDKALKKLPNISDYVNRNGGFSSSGLSREAEKALKPYILGN